MARTRPATLQASYSSPLTVFGREAHLRRVHLFTLVRLPLTEMPLELLPLIIDYAEWTPVADLYESVTNYQLGQRTSSQLAEAIFRAFAWENSRVAFALDELSPTQRTALLNDVNFPFILKLYFFTPQELKKSLVENPRLNQALLVAVLDKLQIIPGEPEWLATIKPVFEDHATSLTAEEKLEKEETFKAAKATFEGLCHGAPEDLIFNVLLQYSYHQLREHRHGIIFSSLFSLKRYIPHLMLPAANLKDLSLKDYSLPGANLRAAAIPTYDNLNLAYSDIRDADIYICFEFNLREGFANQFSCGDFEFLDFLGAHLGDNAAGWLQHQPLTEEQWEKFHPLKVYYNRTFMTPLREHSERIRNRSRLERLFGSTQPAPLPPLELAIFCRGITRSKTQKEMDAFIETFKSYYPMVLEKLIERDINFWQALVSSRERLRPDVFDMPRATFSTSPLLALSVLSTSASSAAASSTLALSTSTSSSTASSTFALASSTSSSSSSTQLPGEEDTRERKISIRF